MRVILLAAWMLTLATSVVAALPAYSVEAHALPCGTTNPIGPNNCWQSSAWAGGQTGVQVFINPASLQINASRPQTEFAKVGVWESDGAPSNGTCGGTFGYCWVEMNFRFRGGGLSNAWMWADKRPNQNFFDWVIASGAGVCEGAYATITKQATSFAWELVRFSCGGGTVTYTGTSSPNSLSSDHMEIGMQVKGTADHLQITSGNQHLVDWAQWRAGDGTWFVQDRYPDYQRDTNVASESFVLNMPVWGRVRYYVWLDWN